MSLSCYLIPWLVPVHPCSLPAWIPTHPSCPKSLVTILECCCRTCLLLATVATLCRDQYHRIPFLTDFVQNHQAHQNLGRCRVRRSLQIQKCCCQFLLDRLRELQKYQPSPHSSSLRQTSWLVRLSQDSLNLSLDSAPGRQNYCLCYRRFAA